MRKGKTRAQQLYKEAETNDDSRSSLCCQNLKLKKLRKIGQGTHEESGDCHLFHQELFVTVSFGHVLFYSLETRHFPQSMLFPMEDKKRSGCRFPSHLHHRRGLTWPRRFKTLFNVRELTNPTFFRGGDPQA